MSDHMKAAVRAAHQEYNIKELRMSDALRAAAADAERAWQTDRLFAYLEGRA